MSPSPSDPGLAAHRAGGGIAPENTMAAFERVLRTGRAGWIEFDVHRTRDGHLLVCHDADVTRTTDHAEHHLPSTAIAELDLHDLRQLDAGGWFGEEFTGAQLPLLTEVLDLLAGRSRIMLEAKSPERYPGIAADLASALRDRGSALDPADLTIWSSDHTFLHAVHEIAPEYPKGWFVRRVDPAVVKPHREILHSIGVWPQITARDVREAHRLGLSTAAATMNSAERFTAARDLGTDIVLTDFPEFLDRGGAGAVAQFDPVHRPLSSWVDGRVLTEVALRINDPALVRRVQSSRTLPWTLRRLGGVVVRPVEVHIHESTPLVTVDVPTRRPGTGPTTLSLHTEGGEVLDVVEFGHALAPTDQGPHI